MSCRVLGRSQTKMRVIAAVRGLFHDILSIQRILITYGWQDLVDGTLWIGHKASP